MSELHRPAANVRAEMARRGIRQTLLAEHLGLSQAAVSRRVNGQTPFDVDELIKVAALLGVPAAALLGDDVAAA